MDAVPNSQQAPHNVETCDCHSCQLFRYQRQYGPGPGSTAGPGPGAGFGQTVPPNYPPPPNHFPPPPAGPGNAGYNRPPEYATPLPPGWYPPPGYPPSTPGAASDRTMASLAHWLPLAVAVVFSFVIGTFAVFLCFIPPLIVMLTAKSEFTGEHAREALNFQLSVIIPGVVILVLSMASPPLGALLRLLLLVGCLIIQIMAAVKASQGAQYRYPIGIRFIRPPQV